jgi:hypothetical protein
MMSQVSNFEIKAFGFDTISNHYLSQKLNIMKMNNLINILLPMLYNQVFQRSLVQKKKKKKQKVSQCSGLAVLLSISMLFTHKHMLYLKKDSQIQRDSEIYLQSLPHSHFVAS